MLLNLLLQYFLMLFIDILDHLQILRRLLQPHSFPSVYLICIQKPDSSVVVLRELSPHFEYLETMHFLDVKTYFQALLHTVGVIIVVMDKLDVFANGTVVIFDCGMGVRGILFARLGRVEIDHYWFDTGTGPGFDTGLYVAHLLPVVGGTVIEPF